MPVERLQRAIARSGLASRRGAEELIRAGRVTVNGEPAGIGASVDLERDRVAVDGNPIAGRTEAVHLAVHKPRGLVSSARDERGRRSVVSLVDEGRFGRLWPAGRLDADSEGLMILTNDGAWANRAIHPRYGIEREYAALVAPTPQGDVLRQLRAGVQLDDGPARLLTTRRLAPPPEVRRDDDERGTWLRVTVGEGRKREVRRILAVAGLQVIRLVRTAIGSVSLAGLAVGQWRILDRPEVALLGGEGPTGRERREQQPGRAAGRAPLAVAIDGPSGSGKSTIGYALAQRLGASFVDTGLMYRALTLAALEQDVDPEDGIGLGRLARRARIHVRRPRPAERDRFETVLLGRRDVTQLVRTPIIDRLVSTVSRHPEVRRAMVAVQRATARSDATVMVGRDIGTVVLPAADLKVYLTATAAVRARRRAAEMGHPGRTDAYLAEIQERDRLDSTREVGPLRRAVDALVVDTGELSVEESVETIAAALAARRPRPGAPGRIGEGAVPA